MSLRGRPVMLVCFSYLLTLTSIDSTPHDLCRFCHEQEETPIHLLCDCGPLIHKRNAILGGYLRDPDDIKAITPYKILHFLKEAGIEGKCMSQAARNRTDPNLVEHLSRFKRTPWNFPTFKEIGQGFEDLGKKIHLDKVVHEVGETVKKVDFNKIGGEIENVAKRVLEEVKKPIDAISQTPKTITYQQYIEEQEARLTGGDDPCEARSAEMPDFFSPDIRKSEIKCAEYSWRVNRLEYLRKREDSCVAKWARLGRFTVLSGENTKPGEFPHMVAIGWRASAPNGTWVFKCGGSLISSKFVLSAGHCVSASTLDTSIAEAEPRIVRLGDKNIIDKEYDGVKPVDKNIIRRIPHPQYASPKKYFDASLFELESEPTFTLQVHPACLWVKPDFVGTEMKAIITGWGVVRSGGREQSPELQKASVDLLATETCAPLLRSSHNRLWKGFQQHQMCAGTLAGGADTCQGDSGGPLQVRKEEGLFWVLGVTSFGDSCGRVDKPGVYSRVSSLLDWIESVVWP